MSERSYREHAPRADLARHVACYWTSRTPPGAVAAHPVHPDGCIDLLCDLESGRLEIVGTMTRTAWIEGRGPSAHVAVRFRPGGAAPILRERADALTDRDVDAEAVLGARSRELVERLREAPSDEEAIRRLERFVAERQRDPVDPRIERAAARLWSSPGVRIEALTAELGITRQHARRLFLEHVGVAPKAFAGLARSARAIALVSGAAPLGQLAILAGYADQSHMTRELGRVTGRSPAQLRALARPAPR